MPFREMFDTLMILTPRPGKGKLLLQYLNDLIEWTYRSGDQGVLRCELLQLLDETAQFYSITTYQDQFSKDSHHEKKAYLDTMNAIGDQDLAIVNLNERRLWTWTNFTRCARAGSELIECIPCGKKREPWDPSTGDDGRVDEPKKGASAGRSIRFANDV